MKLVLWALSCCLLASMPSARAQVTEYGIKVCGREFVRMVIDSCGSSRLRRHSSERAQRRHSLHGKLLDPLDSSLWGSNEEPESSEIDSTDSSQSESDAAGEADTWQLSAAGFRESVSPAGMGDEPQEGGVAVPSPGRASRLRRGVGLARVCCKWGCSRRDLTRLC
ncbi:relaxin-3 [Callorhinchus milii]|uniref:Relaxin family locus C type II n=1 Tax=Callorhinchus milii TaxID=7868 RepID=V9L014_CALMI|nr:relaxin-3 [Callorhinchus milii]|eukprot:gi/632961848/ref/XP_007896986.1/ PREDICTED: uncharacterized protein LOC103181974 [Callorhinchus milii]